MKFFYYIFLFCALVLSVSTRAMSPAQMSSLQQEFKTVLRQQNYDRAQEIVSSLENAGARAIALPLRAQLEAALKEYAIAFGANMSSEFARVKQELLMQRDQNRKNQVLIEQLRKELAAASAEGSALQQQFNRLQQEFQNEARERTGVENNLRNLNTALQNQVNDYLRQITQIQQDNVVTRERLNQELKNRTADLNTARVERDQALAQLQKAVNAQEATQADFDLRLNRVTSELQATYEARIKQLQENLQVAQNTINNMQEQLRNKSTDVALTNENTRLLSENRALQLQRERLEQDLAKALTDTSAQRNQFTVNRAQEEAQRKKVEGELEAERIRTTQLQKDIIELTQLVAARDQQLEQVNRDIKAQFELVQQAQDNARDQIAQKNTQLSDLQTQILQLQEQLQKAAQGQSPDLLAQIDSLNQQIANLQAQLKYKEDFLRSAREYADLKKKQKQQATFELIDVKRERDAVEQLLEQVRKNMQESTARFEQERRRLEDQVRRINNDLQQQLAQAEQQFTNKLNDAVAQRDAEIQRYKQQLNDLTDQLETQSSLSVKTDNQITQLQKQLNNLKTASEDLNMLLLRRFLPDMSGMRPAVTAKDEQALQNKYNELVRVLETLK